MVELQDSFLDKYKNAKNPMTDLGNFVFYRTYSRLIPEQNRREFWWETVKRVVEYNCNLVEGTSQEEAEKLYDNIFNLRQFPSGRSMWVGGTESAKKFPISNFNCSGLVVDSLEDIAEVFYLMMLGTGVGFRILPSDVEQIPNILGSKEIEHQEYKEAEDKEEFTTVKYIDNVKYIIVGDSKEGWVKSLYEFLITFTEDKCKKVIINYNNVRRKGEPLKTFGGFASGHESLKIMFSKIYNIISKKWNNKLDTIDVLDICNLVGENVAVGGTRRSAGICLFDIQDEQIRNAKNSIFTQLPDGTWHTDENLLHRTKSNNSIVFYERPEKEELKRIFESIKVSGEPGFINAETAKKRFKDFKIINPCFTGDTKLLTSEGYVALEELEDKEFIIISKDGIESEGKVWCSGEKTVYAISRRYLDDIKCTGNHVFMLNDGSECEAVDLKGKRLMPFLNKPNYNIEYVRLGFLQGDGSLTRLKSNTHKGLEVNIGQKDTDILPLFNLVREGNERSFYINGFNDTLVNLGFSAEILPNRVFPTTYSQWNEEDKRSFLCGCFSANGSVLSCGRITYKTTCKKFAEQMLEALKEFNIYGYITTNKAKKVKFDNGEYLCKESYDVNIQDYNSRLNFYNKINFVQQYKIDRLKDTLITQSPKVTSVKKIGDNIKVYDFTEPETHWGVIEGYIAHNCAEILLPDKGLCNLVTLNICAFVKEGKLDKDLLFECARLNTRVSYRMACVELELPHWNQNQKDNMLLGCSFTGWQDAMNSLRFTIEQQKELSKELKEVCHQEMKSYAKELGRNESVNVTTLKPEGTLSLLPTVSPGLHYSHSPYFIRRVRVNADDPMVEVCKDLGWTVNNEVGQTDENCTTKVVDFPCKAPEGKTKYDVSAIEQLEIYKMFMENYVDQNASNTITVRDNEWDEVCDWVYNNWNSFVGVSFLALDDTYYPLAPYEKITKEHYEELVKDREEFDPLLLNLYIQNESDDSEVIGECTSGSCPIR